MFSFTILVTYPLIFLLQSEAMLSSEPTGSGRQCPVGLYSCSNTTGPCLEQAVQCNGHKDCPNGADEQNCKDIHGGNLNQYPVMQNESWTNSTCDLLNYTEGCVCTNSTELSCSDLGLDKVPSEIVGNITILKLANNTISSLPISVIQLYNNLKFLHLEGNNISEILPYTFASLTRLRSLFLSINKLRTLSVSSLYGLEKLNWLNLDTNMLQDFDLKVLVNTPQLKTLILSHNKLKLTGHAFPPLEHLDTLELQYNEIEVINEEIFQNLTSLCTLYLNHNKIREIHPNAFQRLHCLENLDLSYNRIVSLTGDTFFKLRNLTKLILSANPLTNLGQTFHHLNSLKSLSLEAIEIETISTSMFSMMKNLTHIYFKKFHYCSYAPHVRACKPKTDGVSSIEHMLAIPLLRISVWVVATLTCAGNVIVIFRRFVSKDDSENNKAFSIAICNLAASDFLMGIYLLIIGFHDLVFREHYYSKVNQWMSSWRCTFSGILAMTSSETSIMILCFVTMERLIYVARPFGARELTVRLVIRSMAAIWTLGILVALMPALYWNNGNQFYGSNGMCFPLHIDDPFIVGWEYSAFIFLGMNSVSVVLITFCYMAMFVSIKKTRWSTPNSVATDKFAWRLFFIIATDGLCWIPIIIFKLLALAKEPITADLYAWVVIFILPINSAINPFVYTFTSPRFCSRTKKWLRVVFRAERAPRGLCACDNRTTPFDCDYSAAEMSPNSAVVILDGGRNGVHESDL